MNSLAKFSVEQLRPNFTNERVDLANMAAIAESAERYEDMCLLLRELVLLVTKSAGDDLTVEERNLLSVAYKNVIGARRASWRTLNADERKDTPVVASYQKQIEGELRSICKDVLDLLENHLLKHTTEHNEGRVFYLKMAGDYYRYLAEIVEGEGCDKQAANLYEQALHIAEEKLDPTHPIRLGLALNYSVCFYEILKDKKRACDLAKKAFDDAISRLDKLDEASYKDSTLIMQLLRDNLTLWTSEASDMQPEDVDQE